MNIENIEDIIFMLYNKKKWKDIVSLASTLDNLKKYRLFWVLPTLNDLCWINDIVKNNDLSGIVSIGCGCGLFEWLFQQHSGLDVIGVELDSSWWHSKYSPPLLLENTIFINVTETKNFCVSEKYALLFCYFNDGKAFCNYVKNYEGNIIFVIGPAEGQNRYTDPLPFDEKFAKCNWKLLNSRAIMNSMNYITVYKRQ